jgi:predicted phosphodiesterase
MRRMRVLALYDIHGNPAALEAVLGDPRALDPDVVLVGGDAVPGPFCGPVLDRLEPLPTRWVRGNGEREVATRENEWGVITAEEIGAERAHALGAVPLTVSLDGVLYCHATPRDDNTMLTRISSEQRYADALAGVSERLVVAGHTHQQHDVTIGDVRFINAGSVGLPYEGDGAARWLWVQDGVPELRQTAYDARAAGEAMLAAGWPDARSITAALIEPIEPGDITRLFERAHLGQ